MALQTSGQISMADIHVEASGSNYASTGVSSLNDADIRALNEANGYTINNTAGTAISMGSFYGASKGWSITLTQGNWQGKLCFKTCSYWPMYGYALYETYSSGGYTYMKAIPTNALGSDLIGANAVTHGSLTDTTFDTISNSVIVGLYWDRGVTSNNFLFFSIKGHHSNSGFTTLKIGSTTFNRTDASHTQDHQASPTGETNYPYTRWAWSAVTNPFSTTNGATHTVVIT